MLRNIATIPDNLFVGMGKSQIRFFKETFYVFTLLKGVTPKENIREKNIVLKSYFYWVF